MPKPLQDLLIDQGFVQSKAELRRVFAQRAVKVDGVVVTDPATALSAGVHEIRIGGRIARLIEVSS